jgi:hypothetical protein
MLGVDTEEIAITRNATESLNAVLLGLPLRTGDEVLTTTLDYWAMLDALDQRRERDGVVVRKRGKWPTLTLATSRTSTGIPLRASSTTRPMFSIPCALPMPRMVYCCCACSMNPRHHDRRRLSRHRHEYRASNRVG